MTEMTSLKNAEYGRETLSTSKYYEGVQNSFGKQSAYYIDTIILCSIYILNTPGNAAIFKIYDMNQALKVVVSFC